MKKNILIIDYPYPDNVKASYTFTSNFIKILKLCAKEVFAISDNLTNSDLDHRHLMKIGVKVHFLHDIKPKIISVFLWAVKSIISQAITSYTILKLRKHFDVCIFFMMQPYVEFIPMITTKLLGKKNLIVPMGLAPKNKIYKASIYNFFNRICLDLADYYVPEYEDIHEKILAENPEVNPEKLLPAAHFFILDEKFNVTKKIEERKKLVGYVGGFRDIKGTMNFIDAIPLVLNKTRDICFAIAGDGILKNQIKQKIEKMQSDRVQLLNWIPHESLPDHMNSLKLLVIPSYSETGPFVAIEAISCGTPVLSTKVGVMPAIITDGETGFILESNSPEIIAERIIEILDLDEHTLVQISADARKKIQKKYSFGATINNWNKILEMTENKRINIKLKKWGLK